MRHVRVICAFFACVLALCACSSKKSVEHRFTENVMNASFDVTASGADVLPSEFELLCREALERVKNVDRATSTTDSVSDVCRFNSSDDGIDDASPIMQELLGAALLANEQTGGAYDPAIGELVELWKRSRDTGAPPDVRVEVALSHSGQEFLGVDGERVTKADEKLRLDLDRIRLGFAAEKALYNLDNSPLEYGTVILGDTVGFFGEPKSGAFTFFVRDHLDREFAKVTMGRGFITRVKNDFDPTTGVSSIIDPLTGEAVSGDVKCVIAASESGAASAAFAYAFAVTPAEKALELWRKCALDVDAIIVTDDGTVYATGRFAADGAIEIKEQEYHLIRIKDK